MIRDIISTESGDNISVYLHNQLMIMITVVLALILLSPSRRQGSHYPFWVAVYLLLQLLERERELAAKPYNLPATTAGAPCLLNNS